MSRMVAFRKLEFKRYKRHLLLGFIGLITGAAVMLSMGVKDMVYLSIALVNCEICAFSLFAYRKEPFTVYKINHLFFLFFFIFANAMQYANNSIVSSLYVELTKDDYQMFQFLVFCILIFYNIFYAYWHQKAPRILMRESFLKKCDSRILILIAAVAFAFVLFRYRHNPARLFFRGIAGQWHTTKGDTFAASSLLFGKLIRPLPMVCYLIAKEQNKSLLVRGILLFMMLVCLFPTAMSRNAVAMYWLPVALLAFKPFKRQDLFVLTMLGGLLIVFPFFDNFRYFNGNISFSFSFDYLNTMNFDASQEFMITMKLKLVTWGRQLLGTLLFFVPRKIWPTKPLGSGATLAGVQGVFSNISMPFVSEGYISFGYVGIFVYAFIMAFVSAYFDKNYWHARNEAIRNWFAPFFFVLVGSAPYLMRGDLMSSFAYVLAIFFNIVMVRFFSSCFTKKAFRPSTME